MKKYSFAFLLAVGLCACSGKKEEASNDLQQEVHNHNVDPHHAHGDERVAEVMAIHDSIMPKMQDLHNLKKEFTLRIEKADSTLAKGANALAKSEKKSAEQLKLQLEQADEAMMDWMHHYNADTLDQLDSEKATLYVAEQKKKIEQVRDLMKATQQQAEKFLQKDKQ